MRQVFTSVAVAAMLSAMSTISTTEATTVFRVNLHDLAFSSDIVVMGQIEDVQFEYSDRGVPLTRVLMGSLEILQGNHVGPRLEFDHLGGHSEKGEPSIVGMPRFRKGQRVLLFLRTPLTGRYMTPVVGLYQGLLIQAIHPETNADVWVNSDGYVVVGVEKGDFVIGQRIQGMATSGEVLTIGVDQLSEPPGAATPPLSVPQVVREVTKILESPDPSLRLISPGQARKSGSN